MEDILPENCMIDILSRLPVKTVIYCKRVCKTWRDLLSNPYFVYLHLSRSHEAIMMPQEFTIPYTTPQVRSIHINNKAADDQQLVPVKRLDLKRCPSLATCFPLLQVGSVIGLICCAEQSRDDANVYIINPVLEEYMTIPRPGTNLKTLSYGFGVSTSRAWEYKVIRVCGRKVSVNQSETEVVYAVEIEVYTLGMGQWRSLGQTPYHLNLKHEVDPGVFVNNHVYWIGDGKIYGFDLIRETFNLYPSPPALGDKQESKKLLGVMKGRLSCISWCLLGGLEVWLMKGKSWYKEGAIQSPVKERRTQTPLCLTEGLESPSVWVVHEAAGIKMAASTLHTYTILPTNFQCLLFGTMIYRPSFVKLRNFGSEKVGVMYCSAMRNKSHTDVSKNASWLKERMLAWIGWIYGLFFG